MGRVQRALAYVCVCVCGCVRAWGLIASGEAGGLDYGNAGYFIPLPPESEARLEATGRWSCSLYPGVRRVSDREPAESAGGTRWVQEGLEDLSGVERLAVGRLLVLSSSWRSMSSWEGQPSCGERHTRTGTRCRLVDDRGDDVWTLFNTMDLWSPGIMTLVQLMFHTKA